MPWHCIVFIKPFLLAQGRFLIIMQKTSYFYEALMVFIRVKRKVLKFVHAVVRSNLIIDLNI